MVMTIKQSGEKKSYAVVMKIYGSVADHEGHGWRSVYCIPKLPMLSKGGQLLSDRLHQVLRWALGSVEIFLSKHCPIWKQIMENIFSELYIFKWTSLLISPTTSLVITNKNTRNRLWHYGTHH
ncbi:hypothetical protein M0R45_023074 [Rubus argutus]|uniref:Uncharacterized protein n=1 Tax=Rubus argutus TaxID=59490 RepID=A0AAW1WLV6_RUBAR